MPSVRIVSPTPEAAADAAERLQNGGLVAFPTETVYGLGANALDANAVAQIFAAKGRPSTNPLIVHVAGVEAARAVVCEWPPLAQKLADAFWPGPLTLVLPKADTVPGIVTAGGQTVGVRVPAHPVALALLYAAGVPIAAPSANRSEEVSPTTAQHVADSLGAFVDDLLILDGGPCSVGLESTVLDIAYYDVPLILRPGMVTAQMLRDIAGDIMEGDSSGNMLQRFHRAPGQMPRHYAPRKPLLLVPAWALTNTVQEGDAVLVYRTLWQEGEDGPFPFPPPPGSLRITRPEIFKKVAVPPTPTEYARDLYSKLRNWDASPTIKRIVVVEPPETPEWAAVHDRLRRAAAPKEGG